MTIFVSHNNAKYHTKHFTSWTKAQLLREAYYLHCMRRLRMFRPDSILPRVLKNSKGRISWIRAIECSSRNLLPAYRLPVLNLAAGPGSATICTRNTSSLDNDPPLSTYICDGRPNWTTSVTYIDANHHSATAFDHCCISRQKMCRSFGRTPSGPS